ncbi:MAG: hypothetical protein QM845_02680 [Verrucomicrobiota bacterium]|nr:hypothetical protein [Verrucomicrobiota bacterium]
MTAYEDDIPTREAYDAHRGTSFVPDTRAQEERANYAAVLTGDYAYLHGIANTEEKKALLDSEFARYRAGYRKRYRAWLSAKSRCVSTMIVGPANFNTGRAEKANRSEHARCEDLIGFRTRALEVIRKKLQPELRPIMAGDDDACDRLREDIKRAEEHQALMKAANVAMRKHAKDSDARRAALEALGLQEVVNYFQSYELTNNSANIRRMKKRLAYLLALRAAPPVEITGDNGITVNDVPAENRVRLTFPDKPDYETRAMLKRSGYRWTPSLGVWQAYRNDRSFELARKLAGIEFPQHRDSTGREGRIRQSQGRQAPGRQAARR